MEFAKIISTIMRGNGCAEDPPESNLITTMAQSTLSDEAYGSICRGEPQTLFLFFFAKIISTIMKE